MPLWDDRCGGRAQLQIRYLRYPMVRFVSPGLSNHRVTHQGTYGIDFVQ